MFFFFLEEKCLRILIGTISEKKMRRQVENNVHFNNLRNMLLSIVNITVFSEKLGKVKKKRGFHTSKYILEQTNKKTKKNFP